MKPEKLILNTKEPQGEKEQMLIDLTKKIDRDLRTHTLDTLERYEGAIDPDVVISALITSKMRDIIASLGGLAKMCGPENAQMTADIIAEEIQNAVSRHRSADTKQSIN